MVDHRTILVQGKHVEEVKIRWKGMSLNEAAWEVKERLAELFPAFSLEDKVDLKE